MPGWCAWGWVCSGLVVPCSDDAARNPGPLHRPRDGTRRSSGQSRQPAVRLRDGRRPRRVDVRALQRARRGRRAGGPLTTKRQVSRLAAPPAHAPAPRGVTGHSRERAALTSVGYTGPVPNAERRSRNGTRPGGGHRAANRVVDILELLAASPDGLALRDVTAQLEAPKSSLLALLRALTARGYLAQGRAGEYRLGPSAVDLGAAAPTPNALMEAARPAVVDLMRRTGETVFLGTPSSHHTAIVIVDKVDSDHIIPYPRRGRGPRPPPATPVGKAIP